MGEELRPRLKADERNKRNNPHANLAWQEPSLHRGRQAAT